MSICFIICSSVGLVLLIFKYRSSRHDGTTCIVSPSHAPTLHAPYFLKFLYFISSAYLLLPFCTFTTIFFELVCALSIWLFFVSCFSFYLTLVTVHINTNRHDIPFPFLAYPFPFVLLLLLLTLALLQEGLSLYTHRPSPETGPPIF
jgi:hypothetical protein